LLKLVPSSVGSPRRSGTPGPGARPGPRDAGGAAGRLDRDREGVGEWGRGLPRRGRHGRASGGSPQEGRGRSGRREAPM